MKMFENFEWTTTEDRSSIKNNVRWPSEEVNLSTRKPYRWTSNSTFFPLMLVVHESQLLLTTKRKLIIDTTNDRHKLFPSEKLRQEWSALHESVERVELRTPGYDPLQPLH